MMGMLVMGMLKCCSPQAMASGGSQEGRGSALFESLELCYLYCQIQITQLDLVCFSFYQKKWGGHKGWGQSWKTWEVTVIRCMMRKSQRININIFFKLDFMFCNNVIDSFNIQKSV